MQISFGMVASEHNREVIARQCAHVRRAATLVARAARPTTAAAVTLGWCTRVWSRLTGLHGAGALCTSYGG
jgi:hypothetical protein